MDNILITVPEFLRKYAISRTSFYKEVKEGRLCVVKRGRRTLITKQDSEVWLQSLERIQGGNP